VLVVVVLLVIGASAKLTEKENQQHFANFMRDYGKNYSATNLASRFMVFRTNLEKINQHNSANKSWTMAMNEFGDLTAAEFSSRYCGYRPKLSNRTRTETESKAPIPPSVDWRLQNAVTPVKNQGPCGSCWSFATTGTIEAAWKLSQGTLLSLSEMQLVDCSGEGCQGGAYDDAYAYVIRNGITSESAYPYTPQDGNCMSPLPQYVATISRFVDVYRNNDASLQAAVALTPVAIAVEADSETFQFYSSGVFNDALCGTTLDHAMMIVGYNTNANGKYWIVKNSWGQTWGQRGYMYLARTPGAGICGVNMAPSYPIV